MSNLVIVAIPDENDRVWKVSSEKIPHLTLLFLGDVDKVAHADQIVQFVEHAASMTLQRFYLPVDRRGELGEDKADVLFFKKGRYDYKAIRDFRVQLLKDNNIRTAYDSTEQFDGPWQPHLTLGYPTDPAKPQDADHDYPFYDIQFTKIAVWLDDFDGPEFLLKDWWDEYESMDAVPMDVAMSDISQAGADFILEHHGVKGMRWGVTKEQVGGAAKAVGSATKTAGSGVGKAIGGTVRFGLDVQFENKAADGRARNDLINNVRKPFAKEDLPAVKARHAESGGAKLKTRVLKPHSSEAKAYRKDARETYIKRLETTANATRNASGTREYTIRERGIDLPAQGGKLPKSQHFWDVSARDAKHAAIADSDDFTRLELITDDDGWITDLKPVPIDDAIAQSMELGAEFLEHFGIKGMHWGQRKAPEAVTPTGTSKVPHGARRKTKIDVEGGENHHAHEDAIQVAEARAKLNKSGPAALSNSELRTVAQRLQLETQVAQLTSSRGQKFITRQLEQQGQQAFQTGVRGAVGSKATKTIVKKGAKKAGKAVATGAAIALL